MAEFHQQVKQGIETILQEWKDSGYLHEGDLFVIGCSTSEVIGEKIGTAGSEEIASILFKELDRWKEQTGIHLAFQCCEHLNRALVVEREILRPNHLEEVSVIPVPTAGGSMAAHAYKQMDNPAVVESVAADAGIDIGETMIGMQLKKVAVPLRFKQRSIGNARVTGARSRPKLIGGKRANYEDTRLNNQC
ncbi:TIGR01440 family protein [Virgibacillus xinjiangensis]|uniref:UPF0340 protein ACFOGI_05075 n=1 Tax=Virgibacillus xinjiangensis TaxID=393090 RepID=A0ABV7CTG1_9BACI